MIRKLNWKAHTSRERLSAIEDIKQSITGSEGYIINYNMFSDLAISLRIEIKEKHLSGLHNKLQKVATLSEFDSTRINQQSDSEWVVFLHVGFSGGTGNLTHEKPMVDG